MIERRRLGTARKEVADGEQQGGVAPEADRRLSTDDAQQHANVVPAGRRSLALPRAG